MKSGIITKRFLPVLPTLAMLIGSIPFVGISASADESVRFQSFA